MTCTAILPPAWAAMTQARAGEKYRPSNGMEGELFFVVWCQQCQRDNCMREGADLADCDDDEVCRIIGDTYAHDVGDPEYPAEWQYGKDGQPCCTAFVPIGEPIPPPRDTLTADLFEQTTDFPTTPTKGETA